MVARFGEGNVFMDVDMAPGVDFVARITEVVGACRVLILVMGPRWSSVTDEDGGVRLQNPEDFVRLELETGLRRPEVTPIPVLVGGARMPRREQLPADIAAITRRNAIELSDGRWRYDVGRLNGTLDELLAGDDGGDETLATPTPTPLPTPTPTPAPSPLPSEPQPARKPPDLPFVLQGMLVAGGAAFAARALGSLINLSSLDQPAHAIGNVLARRTETWAIAAAALAIWLATREGRDDVSRVVVRALFVGAVAGLVGGAIFAFPVLYDSPYQVTGENLSEALRIDIGGLAVTGGLIGALVGSLWRPPRVGLGLVGGALGVALFQLVVALVEWNNSEGLSTILSFGLASAAIAGGSLGLLAWRDRGRSERTIPE